MCAIFNCILYAELNMSTRHFSKNDFLFRSEMVNWKASEIRTSHMANAYHMPIFKRTNIDRIIISIIILSFIHTYTHMCIFI